MLTTPKTIRMIIRRILVELGYVVCEAGNGRRGPEGYRLRRGLGEPGSGGLEHAGDEWVGSGQAVAAESRYAALKIIMVTTETEMDQMASALEAGANEYVMKPFTKDILMEKLELVGISSLDEGVDMAVLNQRLLQPGERIRVMVVDDSVVIRRLVTHALEQDPMLEVVGTASNGAIGMQRIPQLNPDVITLDIEMPDMDGLEMLRRIRREYPQLAGHHVQHAHRARRGQDAGGLDSRGRRLRRQSLQRRIARSLDGPPAGRDDPEDQAVLPPAGASRVVLRPKRQAFGRQRRRCGERSSLAKS